MKLFFWGLLALVLNSSLATTASANQAVPFNSALGYSYNEDSDAIKTKTWHLGSLNEEAAWNMDFYRTQIVEPYKSLNESTAIAKYRHVISEQDGILTGWLGVTHNDITTFHPYAVMYDKAVGEHDHFWASYGREGLGTITAYEQDIYRDTSGLAFVHDFQHGLTGNVEYKHMDYTDGNKRDAVTVAMSKEINDRFKVRGGYSYDSADRKATGIYYVPVQEQAFFAGADWTIPIKEAKMVLSGEQSFGAQNEDGNITRHSYGAEFKFRELSMGLHYDRSGDYWSRTWMANWQKKW